MQRESAHEREMDKDGNIKQGLNSQIILSPYLRANTLSFSPLHTLSGGVDETRSPGIIRRPVNYMS